MSKYSILNVYIKLPMNLDETLAIIFNYVNHGYILFGEEIIENKRVLRFRKSE